MQSRVNLQPPRTPTLKPPHLKTLTLFLGLSALLATLRPAPPTETTRDGLTRYDRFTREKTEIGVGYRDDKVDRLWIHKPGSDLFLCCPLEFWYTNSPIPVQR